MLVSILLDTKRFSLETFDLIKFNFDRFFMYIFREIKGVILTDFPIFFMKLKFKI